jgi:hypothetical protein
MIIVLVLLLSWWSITIITTKKENKQVSVVPFLGVITFSECVVLIIVFISRYCQYDYY